MRTLKVKHETMSICFGSAEDRVQRYQRTLVMFSLLYAGFCVSIWLFWSRSTLCCAEVRSLLGCSDDPAEPCRGYTGGCAKLADQFRDVPGTGLDAGHECTQFPDANNAWDGIIAALIQVAVMLPVKLGIERAFELANEADAPNRWLFWYGPRMWLTGPTNWFYRDPVNPTPFWRRALATMGKDLDVFVVSIVIDKFRSLRNALRQPFRRFAGRGEGARAGSRGALSQQESRPAPPKSVAAKSAVASKKRKGAKPLARAGAAKSAPLAHPVEDDAEKETAAEAVSVLNPRRALLCPTNHTAAE